MGAITTPGYQDLRDYIQATWQHIEVRDTTGAAVVRLPLSDARVDWVHVAGAQRLEIRVLLTGSDSDVPVPVTLRSSVLFKGAAGGSAMSSEQYVEGDAQINADPDNVTITHSVEVPQIA